MGSALDLFATGWENFIFVMNATGPAVVTVLLIASALSAVGYLIVAAFSGRLLIGRAKTVELVGIAGMMTSVGFLTGFIAASTRETVMGDLLPVLLAGLGTLLLLGFVREQVARSAVLIAAPAFCLSLLCGLTLASAFQDCRRASGLQAAKADPFEQMSTLQSCPVAFRDRAEGSSGLFRGIRAQGSEDPVSLQPPMR